MGKKAQEKRKALGEKYIGKHGTNKLRGAAKGRHVHTRLKKINEKQMYGSTLTQARARLKMQAPEKSTVQSKSGDVGENMLAYLSSTRPDARRTD